MEKILSIQKKLLEFENHSKLNKITVCLIKTFLKYAVTILICIFIWFIWIFIAILIWDNYKQANICALIELMLLYFLPSIVYILVFSKNTVTFHPIIVTLLLPVGFFSLLIINYFFRNYQINNFIFQKDFIEATTAILIITISFLVISVSINFIHFLLLKLLLNSRKY